MNFPANLKILRKKNKISQSDLAEVLGVSQRTVSHYEKGDCEPSLTILCNIARYFGVTADELLGINTK